MARGIIFHTTKAGNCPFVMFLSEQGEKTAEATTTKQIGS